MANARPFGTRVAPKSQLGQMLYFMRLLLWHTASFVALLDTVIQELNRIRSIAFSFSTKKGKPKFRTEVCGGNLTCGG